MVSFEEYLEAQKDEKYKGKNMECFVIGCEEIGEYELGDSRYYCPGCAKHAHMKEKYDYELAKRKEK